MMANNWKCLSALLRVRTDKLAHMIGYSRQGLYAKKPNHLRDPVCKKILIEHSDRLYEQDVANAEVSKKMREAEIDKMFGV